MYIQLCDRCERITNNKPAFLLPTTKEEGSYSVNNQWFGKPITLCNECLRDFENFQNNHKRFIIDFVEETNE